jgi:crotonobetainyl-CoA:carnitine CoA-transferase CaiB-like acyl-CoA transferase
VSSSPIQGQHNSGVLREFGYRDVEIEVFSNKHLIE